MSVLRLLILVGGLFCIAYGGPCRIGNNFDTKQAVLAFGYRNQGQVNGMSHDDCRNTMIVELSLVCSESIPRIQGYSDREIIGKLYVAELLKEKRWRTPEELDRMTTDDHRNTIIVETNKCLPSYSIGQLQSFDNQKIACIVEEDGCGSSPEHAPGPVQEANECQPLSNNAVVVSPPSGVVIQFDLVQNEALTEEYRQVLSIGDDDISLWLYQQGGLEFGDHNGYTMANTVAGSSPLRILIEINGSEATYKIAGETVYGASNGESSKTVWFDESLVSNVCSKQTN